MASNVEGKTLQSAKQIISVSLMYFLVITGSTFTLGFFVLFFIPPLWPLAFCYLVWTVCVDWQTFKRGGRRFDKARRLSVYRHIRDYYPISLTKTADLEPQHSYIFGYHPHGMIPEGLLVAFGTEVLGFSDKFPGIVPYIGGHSLLGWSLPIRDIAMSLGVVDVSRDSLHHILTQKGLGHSVVILIGGAKDVLETRPDTYVLTLKSRKGFAKLALQTGSHLVPVFAFGQNNLFHQPRFQLPFYNPRKYSSMVEKWVGVCLKYFMMFLYGRAGIIPWANPIDVVVGSPIRVEKVENPSESQVDGVHAEYVNKLRDLFQENREKYGVPQSTELFIE